jgi:hypothetical protein
MEQFHHTTPQGKENKSKVIPKWRHNITLDAEQINPAEIL